MARVRKENINKQPEQTVEVTEKTAEIVESPVEVIESPVEEVIQEDAKITEEVLEIFEDQNTTVEDSENQELQGQVEETPETVEDQEVKVEPTQPVQGKGEIKEGEAYVVKLNKFLSNKLSKYEVRIKTPNGEKKHLKSSREKTCFVANKLNRSKGFQTNLTIIE